MSKNSKRHWTGGMRPPKFRKINSAEQYKIGINAKSVNTLIEIAEKWCDLCRMKRIDGRPVPLSCDVCRKGRAIKNAKTAVAGYNEAVRQRAAIHKAEVEKAATEFHQDQTEETVEWSPSDNQGQEGRPTRW